MSGKVPFFITGANAKIKVAGKTLAMCTDVSYSIRVKHVAPHVLGVFEAFTQEPQGYEVTGSFTVVRYVRKLQGYIADQHGHSPPDVSNAGNGIGAWGPSSGKNTSANRANASIRGNRPDQSLDPGFMHVPSVFDIEILQKSFKGETGVIARLRNCRIVASDFKLTKRGVALQTFSFQACYADEDSFSAGTSGLGQQFA